METLPANQPEIRVVEKISGQRMTGVFHVNADLVCPSSLQLELDGGEIKLG